MVFDPCEGFAGEIVRRARDLLQAGKFVVNQGAIGRGEKRWVGLLSARNNRIGKQMMPVILRGTRVGGRRGCGAPPVVPKSVIGNEVALDANSDNWFGRGESHESERAAAVCSRIVGES